MSCIFPTLNVSVTTRRIAFARQLFPGEKCCEAKKISIHLAKRRPNMKPLFALVIAGSALLASPTMTLAAPMLIAGPFPVQEIATGTTKVNAFTESNRHRHIRMKHVAARSRSHLDPSIDGYAWSYYNGAVPAVRPVSPGDPGNPYLNSAFDRAVERHQYND
jgi:hypothetical protein